MGLDMYLRADKYVSGFNHQNDEQRAKFTSILAALGMTEKDVAEGSPSVTVRINVAYWRKANAIHAWFVKNAQKGDDDCGDYYVGTEQITELIHVCKAVLENREKAAELLPPQSGFFFGSDKIDDWYWSDLADTVKQLTAIITNPNLKDCSLYYHSSW